jgi:hypothetical protein
MGHQRVVTCQSPGAGKGPPGYTGMGWAGTSYAGESLSLVLVINDTKLLMPLC